MGHLHNGDTPLTRRTRNAPANRPEVWLPPADWESSAKDALTHDGFLGQTDWTLEAMLYRWEGYNGWGYRQAGRPPTPYLWSFSNHYTRGKYASDGRYDSQLRSQQCGAAVMLKELLRAGEIAQLWAAHPCCSKDLRCEARVEMPGSELPLRAPSPRQLAGRGRSTGGCGLT
jgi:lysozyme family protein